MRVAFVLRSVEVQPLFRDLCKVYRHVTTLTVLSSLCACILPVLPPIFFFLPFCGMLTTPPSWWWIVEFATVFHGIYIHPIVPCTPQFRHLYPLCRRSCCCTPPGDHLSTRYRWPEPRTHERIQRFPVIFIFPAISCNTTGIPKTIFQVVYGRHHHQKPPTHEGPQQPPPRATPNTHKTHTWTPKQFHTKQLPGLTSPTTHNQPSGILYFPGQLSSAQLSGQKIKIKQNNKN